jgi:hypothetical protein
MKYVIIEFIILLLVPAVIYAHKLSEFSTSVTEPGLHASTSVRFWLLKMTRSKTELVIVKEKTCV